MKTIKITAGKITAGLLLIGIVSPAYAQSIGDDVRCLVLSSIFARAADTDAQRQSALLSAHFYAGRLDGRVNQQTITTAVRTRATGIDPKTAGAEMGGCAARVGQAQKALQDMVRAATQQK